MRYQDNNALIFGCHLIDQTNGSFPDIICGLRTSRGEQECGTLARRRVPLLP